MTAILKVDTIQDTAGNNIINESSNTITIGASGDTTNIVGTLQNNGAAVGGVNTPAFFAHSASNQNVSDNSYTKATLGTEVFDVGGCFASSRFTVPSGQAGKYFLYASIRNAVSANGDLRDSYAVFYKNGSEYLQNRMNFDDNFIRQTVNLIHVVLDLNVDDYVELYGAVNTDSSQGLFESNLKGTSFGGYKLIT